MTTPTPSAPVTITTPTTRPATPQRAASVYVAYLDSDIALSHTIPAARRLLHAEIAYAYSHQTGVQGVLVVLSPTEPHLDGVEFKRVG